jgi:hypothetical protein
MVPESPAALLFYTDGVTLACKGSPVPDELRHFAGQGVSIVLAGTRLDPFGLRELVTVGTVGGMAAIIEAMA